MANNLKELDVDVQRKIAEASSEAAIHVKAITTGSKQKIKEVSQGGIIELEYPPYEGEYEATPTLEEQVFATKETSMLQDFTVHETPVSEVINEQGGYTLTIL